MGELIIRNKKPPKLPVKSSTWYKVIQSSNPWGTNDSLALEINEHWDEIVAIKASNYDEFMHKFASILLPWSSKHHLAPYYVVSSILEIINNARK